MVARAPRRSSKAAKLYRKAAICGLSNYKKLPPLSHIKYDLAHMRNALIRTGFELDSFMIHREEEDGKGFLDWLAAAFGGAPDRAVLLLHLCGHGTRLDQEWIFCFEEFDPANIPSQTYCCMRQEQLEDFARHQLVNAQLVIVSVDTCNDNLKSDSFKLSTVGAKPRRQPRQAGTVVLVFGAEASETVSSIRGHGGHFTRAWAEAIDPMNWPQSLEDAITFAKKRVQTLCKRHGSRRQRVNARQSREDRASMDLVIFDHHQANSRGASSGLPPRRSGGPSASSSPGDTSSADADFPYLDLLSHDGTLVRLIQSMQPDISSSAEGPGVLENELKLMHLLSERIEQLRRTLRPDEVESN